MTLQTIQNHHQICTVILLSIYLMTLTGTVCGRPDLGAFIEQQNSFMDELTSDIANEDPVYNELKNNLRRERHLLAKWPSLLGLLLTSDYDENALDNNEALNYLLLARLQELASSSQTDVTDPREDNNEDGATTVNGYTGTETLYDDITKKSLYALSGANDKIGTKTIKEHHGVKKNIPFQQNFMLPCHYKLCNMGRKRSLGNANVGF